MKKKITGTIILILALAIGAGIYFYLLHQNVQEPKSSGSTVQTFTEKDLGITFKLPTGWVKYDTLEDGSLVYNTAEGHSTRLYISKLDSKGMTLSAYLKNLEDKRKTAWEGQPSVAVNFASPANIGGEEAVIQNETWLAAGFDVEVAYAKHGNDIFMISMRPRENETSLSDTDRQLFSKILSTIIFLTPGENPGISNVNGFYHDSLRKFSFHYPATWKWTTHKACTSFYRDGVLVMSVCAPIREIGYEEYTLMSTSTLAVSGGTFEKYVFQMKNVDGNFIHYEWNNNGETWENSGEIWMTYPENGKDAELDDVLKSFTLEK